MCASNNNTGETVLSVFLEAAERYGVPNCLRCDHGVENILVAAWIEDFCGTQRVSYTVYEGDKFLFYLFDYHNEGGKTQL